MDRLEGDPANGRARGLALSLVLVTAVSASLCVWQLWVPSVVQVRGVNYPNRNEVFSSTANVPRTWYAGAAYADASLPLVSVAPGRVLLFPPQSIQDDRFTAAIPAPPGEAPFATNIGTGPYFVHVSGLRVVGRTLEGLALAREGSGTGPVHVVIGSTAGRSMVLGRLLSAISLIALFVLGAVVVVRHRR